MLRSERVESSGNRIVDIDASISFVTNADCTGLSGPPARALHRLWRGHGPGDTSTALLDRLAASGLCQHAPSGWSVTDHGERVCRQVEEATNTLHGSLLDTIDLATRERFLDRLGELPGIDPRPDEDR